MNNINGTNQTNGNNGKGSDSDSDNDPNLIAFSAAQQIMTRLGQLWLSINEDIPEWIMEIRAEELLQPEGHPNQKFLATIGESIVSLRESTWENLNLTAQALQNDQSLLDFGAQIPKEIIDLHYIRIIKCIEPMAGLILNKRAFKYALNHELGICPETISQTKQMHLTIPPIKGGNGYHPFHPLRIIGEEATERGIPTFRD